MEYNICTTRRACVKWQETIIPKMDNLFGNFVTLIQQTLTLPRNSNSFQVSLETAAVLPRILILGLQNKNWEKNRHNINTWTTSDFAFRTINFACLDKDVG